MKVMFVYAPLWYPVSTAQLLTLNLYSSGIFLPQAQTMHKTNPQLKNVWQLWKDL